MPTSIDILSTDLSDSFPPTPLHLIGVTIIITMTLNVTEIIQLGCVRHGKLIIIHRNASIALPLF